MNDTQNNLPEGEEQQMNSESAIQNSNSEMPKEETPATETPQESAEAVENTEATIEETPSAEAVETEAMSEPSAEKEEVLSDEDLEKDDDTAEIHGDEDHEEEHPDELEMPDYAEFLSEDLVASAYKLLQDHPIQKLKDHFAAIRKYLMNALNEERAEKLAEFVEQGGNEIDFEFIQPLREQFRTIYSEYRKRRKKYYEDLSAQLDQNLLVKRNLIERLKELVNKEESIGDTFKEFRNIQESWRSTGPVPRNESRDLWRTYHFHVENFYEYVKINKELRDLDYKKNKEHKEELLKKSKAILESNDLREGFKQLQSLHKEWRQVGPVEPELREALWQEFSGVTKQIHEKREEFFKELREKREELLTEKRKLVQQLEEFPRNFSKHHEWQKAIQEVNGIQQAFKKIGRLNVSDNDTVWEEFRKALRDFNQAKNQFYKNLKKEHQENLDTKRSLLARAEELKESENWRDAANELKRIQAEWKKVGHVPKGESDKIWKEFRAACNHFFDRLTAHNKGRDAEFDAHNQARTEFLENLEKWTPDLKDKKEAIKNIKAKISEWRRLGAPSRKMRNELETRFNKTIDGFFKAIDLDRQESQRIRFENKVDSLASQGERELQKERDFLRRKLDEAKRELMQLENNLGFFSSSDPNSPIVKEARKNIDAQQRNVSGLQAQIKLLGQKLKSMREEAEKDASEEQASE